MQTDFTPRPSSPPLAFKTTISGNWSLKGHVALAFGVPVAGADGVYLPLDAVAMRLMGELALVIGRDYATAIVLTHFDTWAGCGRPRRSWR